MLTTAKAYLTPRQRRLLFARARRHRTSLSAEVRRAIEAYLDLPPEVGAEEFKALAREANASLQRSIARLDETIAFCKRVQEKIERPRSR